MGYGLVMTPDERLFNLLDLVYLFYPRGLTFGGLGYDDTVERHRQREFARRGAAEQPSMRAVHLRSLP